MTIYNKSGYKTGITSGTVGSKYVGVKKFITVVACLKNNFLSLNVQVVFGWFPCMEGLWIYPAEIK